MSATQTPPIANDAAGAHSLHRMVRARPWTHEQETEEMTRPSRPEIRRCIECGKNEPETGYICDECRFDALGD